METDSNTENNTPRGVHHRISYARSEGGITHTALQTVTPTLGAFQEALSQPPAVGPKDGPYFVRGPLKDGCTTRSDANIAHSELLILDGDRRFDPTIGEIHEGAPPPQETHDALRVLGIPHVLFTTHSHGSEEKGNRHRVVIPTSPMTAEEVPLAAQYVCEQLASQSVHLCNVRENGVMSQPWYLPRRAHANQEYVFLSHLDGAPWAPAAGALTKAVSSVSPPAGVDKTNSKGPKDPDSVAALYTEAHPDARAQIDLLQKHGYELWGVEEINGDPSYRFLCQGSTSGTAGTVLFRHEDGAWLVHSHHGSDPLNAGGKSPRAHDVFSVFTQLEHGGDAKAAIAAARRALDDRPRLRISGGRLDINVSSAVALLADINPPITFARGNALVRVAHTESATTEDGIQVPAGTAAIIPYKQTTLALVLSREIAWEKWTENRGWGPCDACQKVVATLLDGYGLWGDIPKLRGISECPLLRSDGSLHATPGYDSETQLYVEGLSEDIAVPKKVSLADAQAAAEEVFAVFAEFPFEDRDLDRAVLLAYLLTLLLRPLLPTAPLTCVSANAPGTGKGLLVEVSNILVRGVDAALMPPVSGRESEDEMRKRITSMVLQGLTSLNLDNYSKPIAGDSLNALLTTNEWTDRQLGSNTIVKLPVCCTLAATGNNLTVRGDMVRRSLVIKLNAGVEHPERRSFSVKDLPGYVREHRGSLLKALFTILKGYQESRCTNFTDDRLGRFETWSEKVCHPIQWLGLPSPVASQARLRASDPDAENLAALLHAWHTVHSSDWVTVSTLVNTPEGSYNNSGTAKDHTLHDALLEVAGKSRRIENKLLGWYLSRNEGRIADGYKLERRGRQGRKGKHAHEYRVATVSGAPSPAATLREDDS
ncbi:conserved hypothetical protein [Luminiphilus syltensis NOR5-1B]|uniref:Uncharacterized protein n=1 Tax=Luminiphilus syltensis NOR5-1B TaxID=565045 RepID=B8KVQ7_9GAMM|nr:hypothetical protein [Luminiphilus syltensis]EED35327.1 conserved hypothetical protein [Luminiphilus syltensis NOR5-1B]